MSDNPRNEKTAWKGEFIAAVREGHWEYVQRHGASGAVGIIAITDRHELVLIEQYRIPVHADVIEIPAGLIGDDEGTEGESAVSAAKRELLEETGFVATRWEHLFDGVTTAGLADESVSIVLATGLTQQGTGGGESDEEIIVHVIALDDLDAWLLKQQLAGMKIDLKIYLAAAIAKQLR